MTVETLEHVARKSFETILLVGGPVLVASLVVGILISLFQAMTQLQEATISLVPKLLAIFVTLLLALPWMIKVMVSYTREIFMNIPNYVR